MLSRDYAVDRGQRQRLEAEPFALAPSISRSSTSTRFSMRMPYSPVLVIARLVREDHARQQFLPGAGLPARRLGDALRAFVHREEAADAVAGAVGIIEPAAHRNCRASTSSWPPAVPCREHRAGERDVALEHAGEAVAHFGGGSPGPIQTVRVMSVVPSGYCPPESTR
jgi:hypothetical protein